MSRAAWLAALLATVGCTAKARSAAVTASTPDAADAGSADAGTAPTAGEDPENQADDAYCGQEPCVPRRPSCPPCAWDKEVCVFGNGDCVQIDNDPTPSVYGPGQCVALTDLFQALPAQHCQGVPSCGCIEADAAETASYDMPVGVACRVASNGGLIVTMTAEYACPCYGCPPARLERYRSAALAALAALSLVGCSPSREPDAHETTDRGVAALAATGPAGWDPVGCASARGGRFPCECHACDRSSQVCVVDATSNAFQCRARGSDFATAPPLSDALGDALGRIGDACGSTPTCACIAVYASPGKTVAASTDEPAEDGPYVYVVPTPSLSHWGYPLDGGTSYRCVDRDGDGGGVVVAIDRW
jgi:hypothetical protein